MTVDFCFECNIARDFNPTLDGRSVLHAYIALSQKAGWLLAWQHAGGKSGLHGSMVPGNARRGRPQGKCHRKQTAPLRARALRRV